MKIALTTAVVVACILGAPVLGAQSVATIEAVGWWTQTPGAQAKDDGGFEVARGPSGDLSVAAIRVLVTGPMRKATLVVTEAGGVAQQQAALVVCPTSANWTPADPGAWADRPAPGCDRGSASLVRSATGWAADVLSLITGSGQQPSLVILPDPDASNPVGFQVDFVVANLDVEAEPTPPPTQPAPTFAPPPAEPPPTFPDASDPVDVPAAPDPGPVAAPPIGAAPVQEPGTFVAEGDLVPSEDEEGQPWWRLVVLIPLAVFGGAGAAFGRKVLRDRGVLTTAS